MPKRTRKRKVLARMEWLTEYKTGKPCADCGNTYDPICMDFHHKDPKLKKELIRRKFELEKDYKAGKMTTEDSLKKGFASFLKELENN